MTMEKRFGFRGMGKVTFGGSVPVLLLLAIAWGSVPARAAHAADEVAQEGQVWMPVFVQGEFAPQWKAVLEVQPRVHAEGMSRLVLRPQVSYSLGEGWSVGGGYGAIAQYSDDGVAWEHRIFEQGANETQFAGFKWSNRSRFEQRFLPGADQVSLRWRQQTKANIPLGDGAPWSVVLWDEVFLHLNNVASKSIATGFDQNRAFVGLGVNATDKIRCEFGYMHNYVLSTSAAKPSAINHVASVSLTFTL